MIAYYAVLCTTVNFLNVFPSCRILRWLPILLFLAKNAILNILWLNLCILLNHSSTNEISGSKLLTF